MKNFMLFVVLAVGLSFGADDTGRLGRGDLLKRHEYKTFNTFILFVDPTGNDANSCASSGTAACLTIQAALNKVPKLLQNGVVINVAAGTYAGATISGFTIDPSVSKATAGILLDGALANVAPTTGSATGTATAGSAGSGSTFGTLTDGAATWTVNDSALVGKFVVITGGTGSGQVRVIVSNTATVLTVAGTWTAPTGTSTYALQSPSVNITSTAAAIPKPQTGTVLNGAGIQIFDNVATQISIRNIGVSIAGTTGIVSVLSGATELVQVITSTTTGIGVGSTGGSTNQITLTTCSITTTTGSGINVGAANVGGGIVTSNTLVSTTATDAVLIVGGYGTIASTLIKGTNAFVVQGGAVGSITTSQCDCVSVANSACIVAGSDVAALAASVGNARGGSIRVIGNVAVTNCNYGVLASGPVAAVAASSAVVISGNALTYGASAVHGGAIVFPTATQTITGATAETTVDTGVATATWASYAASFDCLTNLATGSRICRL